MHICSIVREHGGSAEGRETKKLAMERAAKVQRGMLIGGECANKNEPYIICEAQSGVLTWQGDRGWSWMGEIKRGEKYIKCRKYERRGRETSYSETDKDFYLMAEDCRILFEKFENIEPRKKSQRASITSSTPRSKMVELDEKELADLKLRVYIYDRDGGLE